MASPPSSPSTSNALPFSKLRRIPDLEINDYIASGSFGSVHYVKSLQYGKCAGKFITLQFIKDNDIESYIRREIEISKFLRHPNIVRTFDATVTDFTKRFIETHAKHEDYDSNTSGECLVILMEPITGGDLFDKVKRTRRIEQTLARRLFQQLVSALMFLHSHNYIHRDLKAENLLLTNTQGLPDLKLCDFGLCRKIVSEDNNNIGESSNINLNNTAGTLFGSLNNNNNSSLGDSPVLMRTLAGSLEYQAPEVLDEDGGYVGFTCDVWSSAVVLFLMLSGSFPFPGEEPEDIQERIMTGKIEENSAIPPSAMDMIKTMLQKDIRKRATFYDVVRHPWFQLGLTKTVLDEMESKAKEIYLNDKFSPDTTDLLLETFRKRQQQQEGADDEEVKNFIPPNQKFEIDESAADETVTTITTTNQQQSGKAKKNNNSNINETSLNEEEEEDDSIEDLEEEEEEEEEEDEDLPDFGSGENNNNKENIADEMKPASPTTITRDKMQATMTANNNNNVNNTSFSRINDFLQSQQEVTQRQSESPLPSPTLNQIEPNSENIETEDFKVEKDIVDDNNKNANDGGEAGAHDDDHVPLSFEEADNDDDDNTPAPGIARPESRFEKYDDQDDETGLDIVIDMNEDDPVEQAPKEQEEPAEQNKIDDEEVEELSTPSNTPLAVENVQGEENPKHDSDPKEAPEEENTIHHYSPQQEAVQTVQATEKEEQEQTPIDEEQQPLQEQTAAQEEVTKKETVKEETTAEGEEIQNTTNPQDASFHLISPEKEQQQQQQQEEEQQEEMKEQKQEETKTIDDQNNEENNQQQQHAEEIKETSTTTDEVPEKENSEAKDRSIITHHQTEEQEENPVVVDEVDKTTQDQEEEEEKDQQNYEDQPQQNSIAPEEVIQEEEAKPEETTTTDQEQQTPPKQEGELSPEQRSLLYSVALGYEARKFLSRVTSFLKKETHERTVFLSQEHQQFIFEICIEQDLPSREALQRLSIEFEELEDISSSNNQVHHQEDYYYCFRTFIVVGEHQHECVEKFRQQTIEKFPFLHTHSLQCEEEEHRNNITSEYQVFSEIHAQEAFDRIRLEDQIMNQELRINLYSNAKTFLKTQKIIEKTWTDQMKDRTKLIEIEHFWLEQIWTDFVSAEIKILGHKWEIGRTRLIVKDYFLPLHREILSDFYIDDLMNSICMDYFCNQLEVKLRSSIEKEEDLIWEAKIAGPTRGMSMDFFSALMAHGDVVGNRKDGDFSDEDDGSYASSSGGFSVTSNNNNNGQEETQPATANNQSLNATTTSARNNDNQSQKQDAAEIRAEEIKSKIERGLPGDPKNTNVKDKDVKEIFLEDNNNNNNNGKMTENEEQQQNTTKRRQSLSNQHKKKNRPVMAVATDMQRIAIECEEMRERVEFLIEEPRRVRIQIRCQETLFRDIIPSRDLGVLQIQERESRKQLQAQTHEMRAFMMSDAVISHVEHFGSEELLKKQFFGAHFDVLSKMESAGRKNIKREVEDDTWMKLMQIEHEERKIRESLTAKMEVGFIGAFLLARRIEASDRLWEHQQRLEWRELVDDELLERDCVQMFLALRSIQSAGRAFALRQRLGAKSGVQRHSAKLLQRIGRGWRARSRLVAQAIHEKERDRLAVYEVRHRDTGLKLEAAERQRLEFFISASLSKYWHICGVREQEKQKTLEQRKKLVDKRRQEIEEERKRQQQQLNSRDDEQENSMRRIDDDDGEEVIFNDRSRPSSPNNNNNNHNNEAPPLFDVFTSAAAFAHQQEEEKDQTLKSPTSTSTRAPSFNNNNNSRRPTAEPTNNNSSSSGASFRRQQYAARNATNTRPASARPAATTTADFSSAQKRQQKVPVRPSSARPVSKNTKNHHYSSSSRPGSPNSTTTANSENNNNNTSNNEKTGFSSTGSENPHRFSNISFTSMKHPSVPEWRCASLYPSSKALPPWLGAAWGKNGASF